MAVHDALSVPSLAFSAGRALRTLNASPNTEGAPRTRLATAVECVRGATEKRKYDALPGNGTGQARPRTRSLAGDRSRHTGHRLGGRRRISAQHGRRPAVRAGQGEVGRGLLLRHAAR